MFMFHRSVAGPLAALMLSLSLRKLWTVYQRKAVAQDVSESSRDMALEQVAFYSGAGGVLKVLAHMIEHGDGDAALRTIRRFGRQVKAIQSSGVGTRTPSTAGKVRAQVCGIATPTRTAA